MNSPEEPLLETLNIAASEDHSKVVALLNLKFQHLVLTHIDEEDFNEEVFSLNTIISSIIRHIHASDMKAALAESTEIHKLFVKLESRLNKILEEE